MYLRVYFTKSYYHICRAIIKTEICIKYYKFITNHIAIITTYYAFVNSRTLVFKGNPKKS